jgi:3-oxoacyl-(acyl-carrier-protein) synthase
VTRLAQHSGHANTSAARDDAPRRCDGARHRLDLIGLSARRVPIEIALSNGFGFGGVNASVLFQRFPAGRNPGSSHSGGDRP